MRLVEVSHWMRQTLLRRLHDSLGHFTDVVCFCIAVLVKPLLDHWDWPACALSGLEELGWLTIE